MENNCRICRGIADAAASIKHSSNSLSFSKRPRLERPLYSYCRRCHQPKFKSPHKSHASTSGHMVKVHSHLETLTFSWMCSIHVPNHGTMCYDSNLPLMLRFIPNKLIRKISLGYTLSSMQSWICKKPSSKSRVLYQSTQYILFREIHWLAILCMQS